MAAPQNSAGTKAATSINHTTPDSGGTEALTVQMVRSAPQQGTAEVHGQQLRKSFEGRMNLARGLVTALIVVKYVFTVLSTWVSAQAFSMVVRSSTLTTLHEISPDPATMQQLVWLEAYVLDGHCFGYMISQIAFLFLQSALFFRNWPRKGLITITVIVNLVSVIVSAILLVFTKNHLHLNTSIPSATGFIYGLIFNCGAAGLGIVLFDVAFFKFCCQCQESTLIQYFFTILGDGRPAALATADSLDVFQFIMTKLGAGFQQNMKPETLAKVYGDGIMYLYFHPLGVDSVMASFMKDKDIFVQLAAVSLVGWWADSFRMLGLPASELKLPKVLLKKLAEKLREGGEVELAALRSLSALAQMHEGDEKLTLVSLLERLKELSTRKE